jgi:Carboxypeptidase regulatory-like domain/TonB dependent receptor
MKHRYAVPLVARGLFCVSMLFGLTAPVSAQTFFGSIVGTVTDATSAVLPQASLTLTNLGTSERKTAESDSAGNYQFLNLVPGRYRVDVEKTGFKRLTRDEIVVEVQAALRIDAPMQVGDVGQTVEVTAQTPLLQTESASLSEVVDARKVEQMPLNGRNVFNLITLVPGVIPQGNSMTNPTGQNIFAFGNFQVGGSVQAGQGAAFVDGAPVNLAHGNVYTLVPSQDAMQEFRVQTNNLGAEFGRFSGGVVNLTTKSGTNEFHGSLFEFLRNRVLNANTFFNNTSGIQRAPFHQNQFGANIGGPIVKDKAFFFFAYDGFRLRQGQPYLTTVPTDAMRAGDFSNLRTAAGAQIAIYDPATTCGVLNNPACATPGNTGITRSPFPGNVIPVSRLDPAAKILVREWARSNVPGQGFSLINNFATNAVIGGDNDQYNGRVDQALSDRQRIFSRVTYWKNYSLGVDPFQTLNYIDRGPENFRTWSGVVGDTYSFTPTRIGDFRLSFLRFDYTRIPESTGIDLSTIGFPAIENSQVTFKTLPELRVPGYVDILTSYGVGSVILEYNDSVTLAPSLTQIAGRHTIRIGGEIRRQTDNYIQVQPGGGSFSFNNQFTAINPYSTAGTGNAFASYMMGLGTSGSIPTLSPYSARNYYAGLYVNDTFQLSKKLTLSYGVRWELPFPFSERYDRYTVLLPGAQVPLSQQVGIPFTGRLGLVNAADNPSRAGGETHWHLFAPRFGFAYRVTDKTVVRTGYGITYEITDGGGGSSLTSASTPWVPTTDNGTTPTAVLSNPYPGGILEPPQRNPNYNYLLLGQGISAPVPGQQRFAYSQQWNFTIERQFGETMAFEIAYAGNKGTHLGSPVLNQLPDQYLSLGSKLSQLVANPFFGLVPSTAGTLAQPTVQYGQLLRPFPQYTGVTATLNGNRDSIYHSMQIKLEKRFRNGGSVLASYSYSKLISDIEAGRGWLEAPGGIAGIQDNNRLDLERAVSSFDVPHRLVISYVVDLPFGKGKRFLPNVNPLLDRIVGGWGLNGVSAFQSGYPLGFSTASNLSNSFGGGSRPNFVPGCDYHASGSAQDRINHWFNGACFVAPPAFTFGNTPRAISDLRGPGLANYDFAVFKTTRINERIGLQFRTEVFNLFNRVQFQIPNTTVGVAQFGVISLQANNPRLVQLALRLLY